MTQRRGSVTRARSADVRAYSQGGAEPPRRRSCTQKAHAVQGDDPLRICSGATRMRRTKNCGTRCRIAQSDGFRPPEAKGKLDDPVEQGGRNLSGGQRQRLTIARALVRQSGHSDSGRQRLRAGLRHGRRAPQSLAHPARGNPTLFIVSQRASSLRHADQIIVLDDGHVVGIGTHDDADRRHARSTVKSTKASSREGKVTCSEGHNNALQRSRRARSCAASCNMSKPVSGAR